uniref:SET domain-containing protein n=1 Tax=Romanomermis culicivorax TaxID=13658 RepID=A0A915HID0_ROMCU
MNGLCFRHPIIFIKEEGKKKKLLIPEIIPFRLYDTTPKFLCIKKSTIPGAGRGVFAKIDLPCGVAFGPYSGFLSRTTKARLSGYSWQLLYGGSQKKKIWVDAYDEQYSNWMALNISRTSPAKFIFFDIRTSLAQGALVEEEQNMIAMMQSHNMYYYTYKPIPAGTELMVWYGSSYGRYLKIPGAMDVNGSFAPSKEYQARLSKRH